MVCRRALMRPISVVSAYVFTSHSAVWLTRQDNILKDGLTMRETVRTNQNLQPIILRLIGQQELPPSPPSFKSKPRQFSSPETFFF